jgi:16S rRNA (cytidine1402-2'-O)-methyltransferase
MKASSEKAAKHPVYTGVLYVVATPIGHLDDLSVRALRVLSEVDIILAEDTRHSQKLLLHYGCKQRLVSLHEHNEQHRLEHILQWLQEGKQLALISDAGTPLIADPGFVLVRALRERAVPVIPIPGPSAIIAALSVSGLPSDRFQFVGFLPAKAGPRHRELTDIVRYVGTTVCYESPRRIQTTLKELAALVPLRPLVLARELTKQFETLLSGTAHELLALMDADPDQCRGEMVLLIGGADQNAAEGTALDVDEALTTLAAHLPLKSAATVATQLGLGAKNALYQRLLELRESPVDGAERS